MWFESSVLAATAKAGNQVVTKTLVQTEGVLPVTAIGQIVAGILLLPFLLVPGLVHFPTSSDFLLAAWIAIVLNMVAVLFLVKAIQCSDLSIALPFLALSPMFTVFSAWLVRGESVTLASLAGMALVVSGALTVDAKSARDGIHFGGLRVFRDRGVQLVTATSFIYSYTAVFDKNATLLSSPFDFMIYSTLARAILFTGILLLIRRKPQPTGPIPSQRSVLRRRILVLYLLLGISYNVESVFHLMALSTGLVALVVSIKRLSILITSVIGMTLFHEPRTVPRLLGATLMVAGSVIIYLQDG